jgi:hypothetical protein
MLWRKKLLVAVAAWLPLSGCFFGEPSRDEVARSMSPDGQTLAVLLETNGGATTSFGYEVELRSASGETEEAVFAASLYDANRSDCAYGVNLRWLSPTELGLEFENAKQIRIVQDIQVGANSIIVSALPGVTDDGAPCGGMLASQG